MQSSSQLHTRVFVRDPRLKTVVQKTIPLSDLLQVDHENNDGYCWSCASQSSNPSRLNVECPDGRGTSELCTAQGRETPAKIGKLGKLETGIDLIYLQFINRSLISNGTSSNRVCRKFCDSLWPPKKGGKKDLVLRSRQALQDRRQSSPLYLGQAKASAKVVVSSTSREHDEITIIKWFIP